MPTLFVKLGPVWVAVISLIAQNLDLPFPAIMGPAKIALSSQTAHLCPLPYVPHQEYVVLALSTPTVKLLDLTILAQRENAYSVQLALNAPPANTQFARTACATSAPLMLIVLNLAQPFPEWRVH
jgi:hypothetical protein